MSLRLSLLLVAVALAAVGCLRSTTTIEVAGEGSGQVEMEVAVDAQAVVDQAGQGLPLPDALAPQDTAAVCDLVAEATGELRLPADAATEGFEDGGQCGQRISFAFADPVQLTEILETLSGRDAPEPILRQDGSRWLFASPVIRPLDLPLGQQDLLMDSFAGRQEVRYEVTLPGRSDGENNADSVDGGTFTWELSGDDPRTRLQAQTDVNAGGGPPLLVVLAGGLLLAALAGGAVLAASRYLPAKVALDPDGGPEPAEPRWDPDREAWVADHRVEGLLIHDDTTGEWGRA
jgi:hypothetical protein